MDELTLARKRNLVPSSHSHCPNLPTLLVATRSTSQIDGQTDTDRKKHLKERERERERKKSHDGQRQAGGKEGSKQQAAI